MTNTHRHCEADLRHCERSEAISLRLPRPPLLRGPRNDALRNDILDSFRIYLQSHNYSPATIRNYLADISRYQAYVGKQTIVISRDVARYVSTKNSYVSTKNSNDNSSVIAIRQPAEKQSLPAGRHGQLDRHVAAAPRDDIYLFDPETLKSYISSLASDPNYHRYLSSLTKFCQFALDQQLITSNPIKKLRRELARTGVLRYAPSLGDLIKQYQSYLTKKNKTPVTIKNYINDIQQYIRFCQNPSVIAGPFSVIASEHRERGNLNPMGLLRRGVYPVLRYGAPRNDAPRDDVTQ